MNTDVSHSRTRPKDKKQKTCNYALPTPFHSAVLTCSSMSRIKPRRHAVPSSFIVGSAWISSICAFEDSADADPCQGAEDSPAVGDYSKVSLPIIAKLNMV
jgi:hypothetical protein